MSVLIIPRKHLRQPQGRANLAPGVRSAFLPNTGMEGNSVPVVATRGGLAWNFLTSGSYVTINESLLGDWGLLFVARTSALADGRTLLQSLATSGNLDKIEIYGLANGAIRSDLQYTNSFPYAYTADSPPALVTAGEMFVAYVECVGGLLRTTVNGRSGSWVSAKTLTTAASRYTIGGRESTQYGLSGAIELHARVEPRMFDAVSLCSNPYQIFRADPIRIYSFPTGPISLTINSITASNITQAGARITLGLTR